MRLKGEDDKDSWRHIGGGKVEKGPVPGRIPQKLEIECKESALHFCQGTCSKAFRKKAKKKVFKQENAPSVDVRVVEQTPKVFG
jgi:hypothetical protein